MAEGEITAKLEQDSGHSFTLPSGVSTMVYRTTSTTKLSHVNVDSNFELLRQSVNSIIDDIDAIKTTTVAEGSTTKGTDNTTTDNYFSDALPSSWTMDDGTVIYSNTATDGSTEFYYFNDSGEQVSIANTQYNTETASWEIVYEENSIYNNISVDGSGNLSIEKDEAFSFQLGYNENGKNYPVELGANSGEAESTRMYVNVPWTDTVYQLPTAGLALGGIKIGYTSTNTRNYPVQVNNSSQAFVNVPWTDTVSSGLADADEVKWPSNNSNDGSYGDTESTTDGDRFLGMQIRQLLLTQQKGSKDIALSFVNRLNDTGSDGQQIAGQVKFTTNICGKTTTTRRFTIAYSRFVTGALGDGNWWKNNDPTTAVEIDIGAEFGSVATGALPHNLRVDGAITGNSKSFRIPHPILEDKKLEHISIEGPKGDLIYRGVATLSQGTATVSIDEASNMVSGTFASFTRSPQLFLQNNQSFDRVKGVIQGGDIIIQCENSASIDIEWLVVAERNDPGYMRMCKDGVFEPDSDLTESELDKLNKEEEA